MADRYQTDENVFDMEDALRLLYKTVEGVEMPEDADPHVEISKVKFTERTVLRLGMYSLAVMNKGSHKGVVRCAERIVDLAFKTVEKPYIEKISSTTLSQTQELLAQAYVEQGLTKREAREQVQIDLANSLREGHTN